MDLFMLGFLVWSTCGIILLTWRLWSRKGWVLSTNKIMIGLSLGFVVPMLILATAMGMSIDAISNSLSSENRTMLFVGICPGIAVLAFGFLLFIIWLGLRKYTLFVFNASADDVADCVVQTLQSHELEYVEEYPKFVVSREDLVISLVDNFSWVMVGVSNKAQFLAWKVVEQDIAHRVEHKRALRRSLLPYPLLMSLPQLLVIPFEFFFPSFKIALFGENETFISSFFETLIWKDLLFHPLLILFSIFFLALGLRLVFGRPLVFRFNAVLPFFVLIIILAFIVMTIEFGLGWPTIGLFLSDIVLLLWIADLPCIITASNISQPLILDAFQTVFNRNNVHFLRRYSKLYLPRLNRVITVHPNKGNLDASNLIIEGKDNRPAFNRLLNEVLSEIKTQRTKQFNLRAIFYIIVGLLPIFYFLLK